MSRSRSQFFTTQSYMRGCSISLGVPNNYFPTPYEAACVLGVRRDEDRDRKSGEQERFPAIHPSQMYPLRGV